MNTEKLYPRHSLSGVAGLVILSADLILVRGNPLEDITVIREPLGVMAAGRWYSRDQLSTLIVISGSTE